MKALMIAVSFAVLATTGAAYAAPNAADSAPATVEKTDVVSSGQWSPNSDAQPRTRAQVRAELVQAQKSGELAYLDSTVYRGGNWPASDAIGRRPLLVLVSFNHQNANNCLRTKQSLKVEIMKLVQSLIVAAVFAIPAVSFAQSNQPVTRAQVRAELIQLEKAGYNPSGDQTQYPKNIEAAQARVNAENGISASSYGSSTNGTSASSSRAAESGAAGLSPIYARP
jgi:Domain of unknown function (DUF4148)